MAKVRLSLTEKEAQMLLAAASQMEGDAAEHYGKREAAALDRALAVLKIALRKVKERGKQSKDEDVSG